MNITCKQNPEHHGLRFEESGPHIKASCKECGKYIKFLNPAERKELTGVSDK